MNRRQFFTGAAVAASVAQRAAAFDRPPNVVLITTDDLGYGDLGCYGSMLETPAIDRMARQGVRFGHAYSASSVCSPSRAALLTGRYAQRVGVPNVLMANEPGGLPAHETTIAQVLKQAGYTTMLVGKWHLGSHPGFLPNDRGFDEFYGIPYSHDMWPLRLMRNTEAVEDPVNLEMLTERLTNEAVGFIDRNRESRFFLYFPHMNPHIPLVSSRRMKGTSKLGDYGDVVRDIDMSVDRVLESLARNGLEEDTIVMLTSDNGPWFQGSAGRLRGRKGETYEGGMRVPFIVRYGSRINQDTVSSGIVTGMDILPTVANLCGAPRPAQPLDGVDIMPLLRGQESVDREIFLYFEHFMPQCARMGPYKLHLARGTVEPWLAVGRESLPLFQPELYNVELDPGESYDIAPKHPDVVKEMLNRIELVIPSFPQEVQDTYRWMKDRKAGFHQRGQRPSEQK